MSEQEPGPTHTPYGQPDPYGRPSPYGQPSAYGAPQGEDRRPGTVTAASWITIVLAALVAALFGFTGLALVVARDQVITELERVPEFQDANIDADAAVGVLVAVMLGIVVWSLVSIVLAVLVLRRSNVARILLVISSSVTALLSLLTITSVVSGVTLIAAVAVIVLLFAGGASAWFKRLDTWAGGYPPAPAGYPGAPYGAQPGGPYPTQPPAQDPYSPPPGAENPYGQPPAGGDTDQPSRDYPER